jgi:tRNA dimethylallyltransferase
MLPRLVVIVGPTASGKTRLAIDLARRTGAEIVSADSQQVYIGMDIGTGKATADERAAVPHHLLDIVRPDDTMTAARFIAQADAAITAIGARGRPVIVCGGTGLYLRALLRGLFEGPPADAALRAELDATALALGTAHLHARLAALDPVMAAKIDPHDQKRLVRALEVQQLTGIPMSEHQARHDHRTAPARYAHVLIGLCPPRASLHARIEARVDAMIAAGLVDEVAGLRARGFAPPMRSQGAIGYAEVHDHLAGGHALPTMTELIKRNSRRYARRQISWHRPDPSVRWHSEASDVDLGSLERYLGP